MDNLLKPEAANGKQVSIRDIYSRLMHDRLGQEWMQMVVVNDFPAFDDPEGGTYLRRGPSSGLGDADGNGMRVAATRETVALCCSNADFAVLGTICCLISGRIFRDAALALILGTLIENVCSSTRKEGQQDR